MTTLTVLRGLPASGKSTFAKERGELRVSRDAYRKEFFGAASTEPLEPAEEALITKMQGQAVRTALRNGTDVIVDDMNLRVRYVRRWEDIAHQEGAEFRIQDFAVPVDECVRRDALREVPVGEDVIRKLGKNLTDNGAPRPYVKNPKPPKPLKYTPLPNTREAIVVDIDGTLARHVARGPHHYHLVGTDELIEPIAELVRYLQEYYDVIYLTGRPAKAEFDTFMWLARHDLPNGALYTRADGDGRPDYIVKSELFDTHVAPYYTVKYVLDDRNSVVKMWRDKGLTVLQVAEGDF